MLMMRPRAALRYGWAACEVRKGRAGVGLEHGVPLGDGDGLEGLGLEDACVVDEDVEAAEIGSGLGDGGLNTLRLPQAGVNGGCSDAKSLQFTYGLLGFVG